MRICRSSPGFRVMRLASMASPQSAAAPSGPAYCCTADRSSQTRSRPFFAGSRKSLSTASACATTEASDGINLACAMMAVISGSVSEASSSASGLTTASGWASRLALAMPPTAKGPSWVGHGWASWRNNFPVFLKSRIGVSKRWRQSPRTNTAALPKNAPKSEAIHDGSPPLMDRHMLPRVDLNGISDLVRIVRLTESSFDCTVFSNLRAAAPRFAGSPPRASGLRR